MLLTDFLPSSTPAIPPVPVNPVAVFENPQFGQMRILKDGEGNPLFVAKDVALALGYEWNGAPRIAHVPEEWRGVTSVVTPSGTQEMHVLTEQGLYFFLGRSDKEAALPYQKWVDGDVLPSIRKTGGYMLPNFNDPIMPEVERESF